MTTMTDLRTITAVLAERARQDAKWGEQNHPDGTGPEHSAIGGIYAFSRGAINNASGSAAAIRRTNTHAAENRTTWEDILTEEWAETVASQAGSPALADELAQVAAVSVAWLGAIERREPTRPVRVYVSGPIASDPDAREKFQAAADAINRWGGYEAVNPWDVAPLSHPGEACGRGYHPGDDAGGHTSSACFMRTDLLALLSCDAIYLLPGYEASRGAQVELAVAEACGMRVVEATQERAS